MRRMMFCGLLAVSALGHAQGQGQPAAQPGGPLLSGPISDMDTLVVSGVQPGPGMWKVSRGSNVMWVLGTLSPLPKRMQWQSRDVENAIAQAQEVIWAPGLTVTADIGIFQGLLLAPKAFAARRNPGDATLQDVVPADMYSRWQVLKKRYVGRDAGIEKWRPMFAAMELYKEAMDDVGLAQGGIVGPVIERTAKRHKVKLTSPVVKIVIADPKVALKEFRESRLDDLDCFGKTLQRLETDLAAMRDRANAWAIGDIEALRSLPYSDQNEACMKAATQTTVVRKRGVNNVEADVAAKWLETVEKSLATNAVTFASLPMRELLKPDGYLAKLQAKGYVVEAP